MLPDERKLAVALKPEIARIAIKQAISRTDLHLTSRQTMLSRRAQDKLHTTADGQLRHKATMLGSDDTKTNTISIVAAFRVIAPQSQIMDVKLHTMI